MPPELSQVPKQALEVSTQVLVPLLWARLVCENHVHNSIGHPMQPELPCFSFSI